MIGTLSLNLLFFFLWHPLEYKVERHVAKILQKLWTPIMVTKDEQIPLKIKFNSQFFFISSEIFYTSWRNHDFHSIFGLKIFFLLV